MAVLDIRLSRLVLSGLVAAFITLLLNQPIIESLLGIGGWTLLLPLLLVLFSLNFFLAQLFSLPWLQKGWLIALILMAAGSQYFMQQYGIVIDKSMLINTLETDSQEAAGLLSRGMIGYFGSLALLPALFVSRVRIKPARHVLRAACKWVASLIGSLCLIVTIILVHYQSYASTFRENRYLRHEALPLATLTAGYGAADIKLGGAFRPPFTHIAEDAHLPDTQSFADSKPQLVILVLGETVRADHLGLNGYERQTTPKLAQRGVINFGAIDACGTATAVSVPCMFSYLPRETYDDTLAKNSDNVLDVLERAGVTVLWRDNNTGCKEMCTRVETENIFTEPETYGCGHDHCPDTVLLNRLADRLEAEAGKQKPILVVLHQLGNHGPEYYRRSDQAHKQFLPECTTNLLNQCSRQEIVNAYDNAILATDTFLDETINVLESLAPHYDGTMMYMSDHGESLGENGVYLHGLPYWMAPDAQKKVPFLMWKPGLQVDTPMGLSHDYLFDSLLGYMHVETSFKRPEFDMFGTN